MRSAETPERGKNRMRHARILAGSRFVESEPAALQISPQSSHVATSRRAPLARSKRAAFTSRRQWDQGDRAPNLVGRPIRNRRHQHLMEPNRPTDGETQHQEPTMSFIVRKARGTSFALLTMLLTMVVALSSTPAVAAPSCVVEAQISPKDQNVPELTNGAPTVVLLNGEPSKDETSYLWQQTSGPTVTLSDPTDAKPTFRAPSVEAAGAAITIRLTVTGCSPAQHSSVETTINVTNVVTNRPPAAAITVSPSASVNEGVVVTLDGTRSSDPDNDLLAYSWEQLEGPA